MEYGEKPMDNDVRLDSQDAVQEAALTCAVHIANYLERIAEALERIEALLRVKTPGAPI